MNSCQDAFMLGMLVISAIVVGAYALGFAIAHWWSNRCITKQHKWKLLDIYHSPFRTEWDITFHCTECAEKKAKTSASVRYIYRLIKESDYALTPPEIREFIVFSRNHHGCTLKDWWPTIHRPM